MKKSNPVYDDVAYQNDAINLCAFLCCRITSAT